MRHGKKFNHLGRKVGHRRAMLSNMACSLIEHKQINTTTAKAKALRVYIEPLLTKSKDDSTHSRRVVFGYLQNKFAVTELFREVAPKIQDRPGGYTRIIKTGFRQGDGAEMAMIELVDFNEIYSPTEKKTKSRRRRKSSGSAEPKAAAAVEIAEEAEVIVEETPEVAEDVKVETSPEAEVTAEAVPEVKETEEKTESDEPKASSENESDSKEEKKD